jgi:hypothetical protein
LQKLIEYGAIGGLQRVRPLNLDEFRRLGKSVEVRLLPDGKTAHSLNSYH